MSTMGRIGNALNPFHRERKEEPELKAKLPQAEDLSEVKLCLRCQAISVNKPLKNGSYSDFPNPHHPNREHFFKAAEIGCRLCIQLLHRFRVDLARLRPETQDEAEKNIGLIEYRIGGDQFDTPENTLRFCVKEIPGDVLFFYRITVDFELIRYSALDEGISNSVMEENTKSTTSLNLCRGWIDRCRNNHPSCQLIRLRSFLPTRLLDIGTSNGIQDVSTPSNICLQLSSELSPSTQYVTLSHCWGRRGTPTRLLASNVESMMNGVAISGLPATFQDALTITRALGLRYIWIDSLCIIQDSVDDWETESVAMDKVYKSALCNIAATAGGNSTRGCFSTRRPELLELTKVYFQWDLPALPRGFYDIAYTDWYTDVGTAPLNKRAWVLQERILSHRVLHFTGSQIYFECNEGIYSEVSPSRSLVRKNLKQAFSLRGILTIQEPLHESLSATEFSQRGNEIMHSWHNTLSFYRRMQLTKEEDKLIAIAGLAKEVQRVTGWTYVAGLWKFSIEKQLLWCVYKGHKTSPKPMDYRAPSWSWASAAPGGEFMLFFDFEAESLSPASKSDSKIVCEVTNVVVNTSGGDEMSSVRSAYLEIRGQLHPATWGKLINKTRTSLLVGGKAISSFQLDFPISKPPLEVWVLPVYQKKLSYSEPSGIQNSGLVLLPVDEGKENIRYRRAGYFEADLAHFEGSSWRKVIGRDKKYLPREGTFTII